MKRVLALVVSAFVAVGVVGCNAGERSNVGATAEAVISDAAHGGNPGLYWLPPMAESQPNLLGAFDAKLTPIVEIDALDPLSQTQSIVASYTTTSGPS